MNDVVITAALRSAVGKFQGSIGKVPAAELGAQVIKALLARTGVKPGQISEVIMGQVLTAGVGQNPARQALIRAGLPDSVPGMTINKVCGSGLKATHLAAQAIRCGDADIVIAGGQENMSAAPHVLEGARDGFRMGDAKLIDSMIRDGLWDVYNDYHMGTTGENVAEKYHITREQQDEYALNSHRKAISAIKECRIKGQIVPVELPAKKKGAPPTLFSIDESPREDTSAEALRALKPAFKKDGTVTAGNAPGVNDGAAALVVMSAGKAKELGLKPMARVVAQAASGLAPEWVMLTPIETVRQLWKKTGWKGEDVDLYEINEAFSVAAIAVTRELGLDLDKVNVNGGAVAYGHPIGATGARILTALIYEMIRRDVHKGIAALCLGGGNAVGMAVER